MKNDVLEKLRKQLNKTEEEWAPFIGLSHSDYKHFRHNTENIPAQTVLALKSIMLTEEQRNLEEYYNKFANEKSAIFTSNKIFAHMDKLKEYLNPDTKMTVGPITVELHPSTKCNHACPGCVYSIQNINNSQKQIFDMDLFPQLLEDMRTLKVKGVNISGGGEPLTHPECIEIIKRLKESGFDVGLITNGALMKESYNIPILENCQWIRFSIDAGSDDIYKEMHGNVANFEDTVERIKKLIRDKNDKSMWNTPNQTTIGVSYLLTPNNYLDVIPAINLFEKIGIDYIQIKPIILFPEDRLNLSYIFWEKEIFNLLSNVSSYSTDTFKVYTISHKFAELINYEKTGIPFKKCYGHALFPTIASDGAVLACCFKLNDYFKGSNQGYYGNIKDKSLLDIWKSEYRFQQGEKINTRHCPINCKIAESNKILKALEETPIQHPSFIN